MTSRTTSKHHLPLVIEQAVTDAAMGRSTLLTAFEQEVLLGTSEAGPVTCTKGCHHCCYHPVTSTLLEGIVIFRWLQRHRRWTATLKAALEAVSARTWNLPLEVWMLSRIPCPLLDRDGLCSVYESRPAMCQTAFSRGDPYYCEPHRITTGEAGLISRAKVLAKLEEVDQRLLKQIGMNPLRLPLATALLYAGKVCEGELDPAEVGRALWYEHQERG